MFGLKPKKKPGLGYDTRGMNGIEKYRKSFKTIEFAIFSKFNTVNYDAFKAVLEG